MMHDNISIKSHSLEEMGTNVVAYMREMTAEDIQKAFPETPDLEMGRTYWALFAADGAPLVLAHEQNDITSTAFYHDLKTILPN